MNLPNKLTIFRIILTFLFMALFFTPGLSAKCLALAVFIIASLSDVYDGYLARRYNLITDLGKFLDPLADKILVLAAFLAFVEMRIIAAWMVMVIIVRELLITGMRMLAAGKGVIVAATLSGKHKTISQMVSIFVILVYVVLKEAGAAIFPRWDAELEFRLENGIYLLMLVTVGLTIISGVFYFKNNWEIFTKEKAKNAGID